MSRTTVPRRRFLLAGTGGAVGAALLGVRPAAAQSSPTVTLYRLNPSWGTPILDSSGRSRTKCSGKACHKAAPHRYFLTLADALAGRLHPCCLAQPEPVQVSVDLNALMPYYRARHGGVDMRCPELPAVLRDAIVAGRTESRPTPPAEPAPAPTPVLGQDAPAAALAFTGSESSTHAALGAALVAGGIAAVALGAASRRDEPDATQA